MAEIEVKMIGNRDNPPDHVDHVLIEPTPRGHFAINGNVAGPMSATYIRPDNYDTFDEAMKAALAWAQSHNVGVIYVKADR
jgi:hypothetical protein